MKWYGIYAGAFLHLASVPLGAEPMRQSNVFGYNELVQEPKETHLDFSVLSYNIHGLPAWIALDNPKGRIENIPRFIGDYDLILLQEDFAYHCVLTNSLSAFTVIRGNSRRSPVFSLFPFLCGSCGSGLTTLASKSSAKVVGVQRVPFDQCEGWLSNGTDCWATKGFLRTRLRLLNGAELDLYNLHLDAGVTKADHRVRELQLSSLAKGIKASSTGAAIIIAGDFNLDLNLPDDRRLITYFSDTLQLTNADIRPREGKWPRVLDYILYRSGVGVKIHVIGTGESVQFTPGRNRLSDHPALYARFRIEVVHASR